MEPSSAIRMRLLSNLQMHFAIIAFSLALIRPYSDSFPAYFLFGSLSKMASSECFKHSTSNHQNINEVRYCFGTLVEIMFAVYYPACECHMAVTSQLNVRPFCQARINVEDGWRKGNVAVNFPVISSIKESEWIGKNVPRSLPLLLIRAG